MYKSALLALTMALSINAQSASYLQSAAVAAGDEASFEVSPESIWAIEVIATEGQEAEVSLLSHEISETLKYDCHFHGTQMACHELGHQHKNLKELSELNEVTDLALTRLDKTLSRRGLSIADLESFKIWKLIETEDHDHDGHGGHEDFWIRATVLGQGYFQQCHIHPGETEYSCHYKTEADLEDEPQL